VFLNLIVHEFEHLKTVGEGCLRRFGFRKEIDDFTAGERLLNVLILEENNLVTVRPDLSLHSIWEYNLLLAALVELLPLTLGADHLVDLYEAFISLIRVVLLREHQVKIFFLLPFDVLLIHSIVLVNMFV